MLANWALIFQILVFQMFGLGANAMRCGFLRNRDKKQRGLVSAFKSKIFQHSRPQSLVNYQAIWHSTCLASPHYCHLLSCRPLSERAVTRTNLNLYENVEV